MMYLNYNRFRSLVDGYFERFRGSPEISKRQVDRNFGYFDIVRFFGAEAVDPAEIAITYQAEPFEFTDDRIARFAVEIEKRMTAEGRLYSGPPVMKQVEANLAGPNRSLTVQPCHYGLQAGSCLALDYRHPLFDNHGGTLREYYLSETKSREVRDNPLAICLGVSAWVVAESAEGRELLVVNRAAHLASLESSFGPSVAGSVEYDVGGANLLELLHGSLAAETSDELGLAPTEYQCVPLAHAREIFRGERPQLFGAILTHLTPTELTARLERLDPERREFDDYEFLPLGIDTAGPGRWVDQLNFEGGMNLELLSQYYRTQKS